MTKMRKLLMAMLLFSLLFLPLLAKAEENNAPSPSVIKLSISDIEATLSGGVSGAFFYANNEGSGHGHNRASKWVLTNDLFDFNLESKTYPVSLDIGLGGVATPSIVDNVCETDSAPDFRVEYADFSVSPIEGLTLEGGLLEPVAGYEDTYTFRNKNITVGVVASQQPYNAYGARATYTIKGYGGPDVDVFYGYYRNRLEDEEYAEYVKPHDAWETGLSTNVLDTDITLYHYHINSIRSLTGIAIERDMDILYVAFNMDYWKWSNFLRRQADIKGDHSIGAALYVSVRPCKPFELPLRVEYIDQCKSGIYTGGAGDIYAITATPTLHLTANTYARIEGVYVHNNDGFENGEGNPADHKWYVGTELGFTF